MLGSSIRVTHNGDANVPYDWFVESGGQVVSGHDTKKAAVSKAEKKARGSSGDVELVVETVKGSISRRKNYEGNVNMPGLDDIDIM